MYTGAAAGGLTAIGPDGGEKHAHSDGAPPITGPDRHGLQTSGAAITGADIAGPTGGGL